MLKFCRIAAAAIVFASAPVLAASVAEEAQSLLNQGNAADALRKVETHLQANPQDAQARFVRGLALVRLNRIEQAIRVFADLTRDYPQLPEPYNNLAVLYAQQGDYERARDALEAALATHPSYATAHENLGDIYAALAGLTREQVIAQFGGQGFGAFKPALADLAVASLAPVTAEMRRLMADPAEIDRVLKDGADRASAIADPVVDEVKQIVGFWRG